MRRAASAGFLLALAAAGAHAADAVTWYTLTSGGTRTGWVRAETHVAADGSERLSERVVLVVRELGHAARIERRVALRRAADGTPLEYDYLLSSGTVHENWHGTFAGNVLRVAPVSGAAQRVALPDDTLFTPERSARFAALWKMQQSAATLTVFDPARRSAGPLRVKRIADADGADAAGSIHLRSGGGAAAGGEDLWFDAGGTLQRLDTQLLGAALRWTPCTTDCEADVAAPLEAMQHLVVRSPVDIPEWSRHRTLRYVIARADGGTPELAATPEQARAYDGARAVITICEDCGTPEPLDADALARYTAPNAWVRSDAGEIRGLALATVPRGARNEYRMQKLVNAVMLHMRGSNDLLGYADALTALRTGAGDCTEFAVLLAALARAQGIPTRVVAGLVYSDRFSGRKDVFAPHMWVQAWDGTRWKSYDAALGEFDATHIALVVGSGAPDDFERVQAQIPQLRIEKAGIVQTP